MTRQPAVAPRLPAHYEPSRVDAERHAPWIIATLLEEGDTTDLRWLMARYGAPRLAGWLAERGGRQLSRRSAVFWRLVFDVEPGVEAAGGDLWPR